MTLKELIERHLVLIDVRGKECEVIVRHDRVGE